MKAGEMDLSNNTNSNENMSFIVNRSFATSNNGNNNRTKIGTGAKIILN